MFSNLWALPLGIEMMLKSRLSVAKLFTESSLRGGCSVYVKFPIFPDYFPDFFTIFSDFT